MIAAYGFGAADRVGNVHFLPAGTLPPWTTDGGAGRVTFGHVLDLRPGPILGPRILVGGSYALTPDTYPTINYLSGSANPYAAGSFLYRDVPWAPSPQSATSHAVTLDGSGYDLAEGKDLGLLPPTVFFGTVTGEPLVNGQTQPATPRAGWAVGLLADRVVLAVDAGGTGAPGFTPDWYFTGGTPATTGTGIDTSRVANAPAQSVYQTGRDSGTGSGFTYALTGLAPGANYTVRLHFAETQLRVAGQRKFNVWINGTRVLFDFDIVAAAGAPNTAIAREFSAQADASGAITVAFTDGSAGDAFVNAVQVLSPADAAPDVPKLAIDAGSTTGVGGFAADRFVTGGIPADLGAPVDTSRVLNPAPAAVYGGGRSSAAPGPGGGFTYTLTGFDPGRSYTVRLHFAEIGDYVPGQRKFNVDINSQRVLTEFESFAAAGGYRIAYAPYFETVADARGRIVIAFTNGSADTALVNGIEVFEPTNVVATATTDVQGNYALVTYGAGQYTVVQQPPAGWQQLAPEYSTPTFAPTVLEPSDSGGVPLSGQSTDRLATADFDSDGRTDVLVAGGSRAYILFNRPDGTFRMRNGGGTPASCSPDLRGRRSRWLRSATSTATTGRTWRSSTRTSA